MSDARDAYTVSLTFVWLPPVMLYRPTFRGQLSRAEERRMARTWRGWKRQRGRAIRKARRQGQAWTNDPRPEGTR